MQPERTVTFSPCLKFSPLSQTSRFVLRKEKHDGERKIVELSFSKVEDSEYSGGGGYRGIELDEINSDRLFLNYRASLRTRAAATGDGLKFPPSPLSVRQSLKFKRDSSGYSGEYAI